MSKHTLPLARSLIFLKRAFLPRPQLSFRSQLSPLLLLSTQHLHPRLTNLQDRPVLQHVSRKIL